MRILILFVSRGISSVGRALAWHARGQGFKSPILHSQVSGSQGLTTIVRNDIESIPSLLSPNVTNIRLLGASSSESWSRTV